MSHSSDNTINEETKLHIKLTGKGMFIYGEWSKEKLLSLLKNKLVRHHEIKSLLVCSDVECDAAFNKSLHSTIHSGIYNECILLKLEEEGMSPHSIIKAIKHGLISLNPDELKYFQDFEAEIDIMDADADKWTEWTKKLDEKLIWNLMAAGLTENQCWNVIMGGLVSQNENTLYRLLSSGIDVPGFLSWPGQIKPVTPTIIRFLKTLGIDEDTLHYVKENGIDDEIEDMLIDLGYNEYKEKEVTEEILCECSLTILESDASLIKGEASCSCDLNKTPSSSVSISVNTQHNLAPSTCTCHVNLLSKEPDNEDLKKNDYLRQNVMVPLSWAISRALKYQPSDPTHYIAHQLLRWKYGNIPEEEIDNAQQFIVSATIALDQKLIEKHKREQEDTIRRSNEAAMKNIECKICLERQKLYRIKKRCWKCIKVPISA